MKKITAILLAGSFYIATAQVDSKDMKFLKTATQDGLLEVKLGELAQSNATTPEVKTHGRHMIEDHTKTNEELRKVATRKNVDLPISLDEKKQKQYDKLAKLEGKKFDKMYSKYMVKDHKKAISLFKRQARRGKDSDLKEWADAKLPDLESHLDMWKEAKNVTREQRN